MKHFPTARHPIELIKSFTTLTPELETGIRAVMREHTFGKGDIIQGGNVLTSYAYFICEGAARVFYTAKGKEHTVSFAFSGEFVLLPHNQLEMHAETLSIEFLSATRVVFIPHLQVKALFDESGVTPDLQALIFICTALFQYCALLEERVEVMQTLSAAERYRWALSRYPMLEKCATTTQIASFLGLTKETLYRIKNNRYSTGTAKPLSSDKTPVSQ